MNAQTLALTRGILLAALLTGTSLTQAATPESPQPATAVARPAIVGVAHIGLKTDNLAAARKFYTGVLGFQEPFSLDKTPDEGTGLLLTYFKVNDHQYIEMFPELTDPKMDRLSHISFETTDAEQMRAYLGSRGVKVPEKLEPMQDGNRGFDVIDPDGHDVEFVEFRPGSLHSRNFGKFLPDTRISTRIIHVGVVVKDRAAADRFYKDILGFRLQWQGGMRNKDTDWVAMRVPEGTDWLEYMLNVNNPDPHELGVMHHLSLGVPSIQDGYKLALKRGYQGKEKPQIGRDGKWQYNLYDPNFTRVELMEPKPVQKPCCSPIIE
jgi:lactoylglutathione lyase